MSKEKTIVFYAPVGSNLPPHMLGGGENGCRRTREILLSAGYDVITVDKATMAFGAIAYLKSAVCAFFSVKKNLKMNPDAILYVVGFYENNLFLESILLFIASKSHKTIYEARNGRLIKAYLEGNPLYRKLMDSVLTSADVIFAQGLEYIDFISENYKKKAVYTPNYVLNKYLKPYVGKKSLDIINLLYFGRVSESKNVDVVIKTAACLQKHGYKTNTVIIGGYTEKYKETLEQVIIESELQKNTIHFLGQQPFDVISDELQKAHFFIFPSQERMEGHSNSLTEAMTFGVVPIVSNAGFNRSIVGNNDLVLDTVHAEEYAAVVEHILEENEWSYYSDFVYKRVKEHYTEDIVKSSILNALDRLN